MVCFTISSTERYRTLQQVALDVDRADTAACCDGGRTGAMLSAARAGHHSPPQYSMTPMAALERLSCSMAAIICVVQLVLDGHSASAARRVAWRAQETHKRPWWGRVAKPLLCALPTLRLQTIGCASDSYRRHRTEGIANLTADGDARACPQAPQGEPQGLACSWAVGLLGS